MPAGTLPGVVMEKKKSRVSAGPITRLPNSTLNERTLVIGSGGTVVQFGGSQAVVGPPTSPRQGLPEVE